MIIVTNLRGEEFTVNCDLIETISENPDTTMLLTSGINKAVEYHKMIHSGIY